MSVSTRVTKCREALGWSKAELARRTGFPRATITHVEQRDSDGLSAKTLKKLADALNVSADYLLGRTMKDESTNKRERVKMKKINALMLAGFLVMATHGLALAEDKVKVLQCPMDQYTVPKDCPLCGMKLEEKEMTAADAQAAIDKAKDKMRNRS